MSDALHPTKREIVTLSGRVQAVGFRDTVMTIAARHRVAGTVRNLRDGRLEIDVEGEPADVDAFVDDVLAHPPRYAIVDRVERANAEPRGATRFELARTT